VQEEAPVDGERCLQTLAALGVNPDPARRDELAAFLTAVLHGWRRLREELSIWDESATVNEGLEAHRDG
jgi:hypothetical protein